MKNYYSIFFFLVVLISNLKGYEYKFEPQAMSNDFNGIASKGNIILCYGNYGVILRTKNDFKDIQQINIGFTQNIKKITTYDNYFYALTQTSIYKSMNDGTNWIEMINYQKEELNDININENKIYILKKNGNIDQYNINFELENSYVNSNPLIINPQGLIIQDKTIYYFDYSKNYNEFTVWKYNKFQFEKNIIIYSYKDTNKQIRIVDFKPFIKGNECFVLLKDNFIFSNSIFIKINLLDFKYDDIFLGKSDIGLFQDIATDSNDFFVVSGDSLYFPKISKINKIKDSLFFKQINSKGIDRYLLPSHKISNSVFDIKDNSINDFKFIDNNRIVIVGKNKLIAFSNDNGLSWQLISFFPSNFTKSSIYQTISNYPLPYYDYNNEFLYYLNKNEVFHTSNNGTTWITQYDNLLIDYKKPLGLLTNSLGKIYLFTFDAKQKIYLSNDNGNNFNIFDSTEIFLGSQITDLKPEIFLGFDVKTHFKANSFDTTVIKIYNIRTKVIDSVLLNNFLLYKYLKISDEIYLIGLERKDWSSDNFGSFYSKITAKIYKSFDGFNWQIVSSNIGINSYLTNQIYNGVRVQAYDIDNITYFKNKIFFTQSALMSTYIPDLKNSLNILYSFDIEKNYLDSLIIPNRFNNSTLIQNASIYFTIKDNLFLLSNERIYKIYYKDKLIIEDSLYYKQMIPDWVKYDISQNKGDIILYTAETKDFLWIFFLRFKIYQDETGMNSPKITLIPIRYPLCNLLNIDAMTEKTDVYLYNEPPYPIPAENLVSVVFYWNSKYDVQKANYELYNSYGEKLEKVRMKFIQESNYRGKLIVDCNGIQPGVYILQIKLGEDQKSVPILISK